MSLSKFYEYLEQVEMFIESRQDTLLKNYLSNLHAADIAEILENLDVVDQRYVFNMLELQQATEVLEELNAEHFHSVLNALTDEMKTDVLDLMSQDDMADKLSSLSEHKQNEILSYLAKEDAADVKELLVYDDYSAGRLMTKDFVYVKKSDTIFYAIETLRFNAPDAETIYYVYVTDEHKRLVGVISLRELLIAAPNRLISSIMHQNLISVHVNDDQEEVAKIVSKYDLLAIPVVDDNNTLMGIITVDDVLDIVEEEATEDIFKFVGASDDEVYESDSKLSNRIKGSVKSRLPWLIVTIFGGLLSASVIAKFQTTISANATLALFMPLLAGMGGNIGTQSSTITVRNMAVHEIEGVDVVRTLIHEISVGLIVGVICALIVAGASFLMNTEYHISIIVGISMWANMATASTIGTLVPFTFKKLGIDPAVASAPFITTTIDITGLSIYFTLATTLIAGM